MSDEPVRLCFVCLGNICRSPTAEAVMAALVDEAGLGAHIEVDSAGTAGWHIGEPPDERSTAEARRRGIAMRSVGRQFHVGDFEFFDYVLAMDLMNRADLLDLARTDEHVSRIHLLRSFDPVSVGAATTEDELVVGDPYYGGVDGFARVFDQIEAACRGLLGHLQAIHF